MLNLTQHQATAEQVEAGVVEPKNKKLVQELLTFNELPTFDLLKDRAYALVEVALQEGHSEVMIGGAPFFMGLLEHVCSVSGLEAYYSFSARVSEDTIQENGDVIKTVVFKHLGFYKAL